MKSRLSADPDAPYTVLGYFFSWFSAVEMGITMLLARIGNFHDLDAFDAIAAGLQPRQKVERLRQLAKKNGWSIGPNFDYLLTELIGVINLRNDLSHARLTVMSGRTPKRYQLVTLSKVRSGKGAREIRELDLFGYGLWLHEFATDLLDIPIGWRVQPQTLEIENPRTPVGKAPNSTPPQPEPPASGGKPG